MNWAEIRRHKISPHRPDDWPPDIQAISLEGLSLVGIHQRTGELYWDGQKLVTEKRFSDFERGLAVAGLLIAFLGVAAAIVQAWAAVMSLPVAT